MANTDQCRDRAKLNPLVKIMLDLAITDLKKQGVDPLIVETYRPNERQQYLYCQGRTIAECTEKGITTPFAKAYCNPKAPKVTWTLDSIHVQRKAVDVVPQREVKGKMIAIWNSKDEQTKVLIGTMARYGFEPGANWESNPDSPHFQVKGNFTTTFDFAHTTPFVTMAIQIALNKKTEAGLVTDGAWGAKTTAAVNKFRAKNGWSKSGKIGTVALKKLLG